MLYELVEAGDRPIAAQKNKFTPETPKVQTFGAKIVVQKLRSQVLDVERIVGEAGLEMREIDREEGWIPFLKHAALLEIAAHETGDDLLGLHMAKQVDPRDLGTLGYIGLSSRTLGDAFLNLERYMAIITEAFSIELSLDRDLAYVKIESVHGSFARYRQAQEYFIASFVKGYQFFVKGQFVPSEVLLAHQYDGDGQEHKKFLGCPVRFGQRQSKIILKRTDLATPIETADYRLLRILISYSEELLKKSARNKPEIITRLEHHIIDLLPKGQAKAMLVATRLGMSERTLIRNLAKSGTSFTEILNQLRHELALKYLHESELKLIQIAFLLGYANQSAFSTAFKRNTGQTPGEMRLGRLNIRRAE